MPSPKKPQRSSGTFKHVHWEDAKKSASNFARSFRPSSRRPASPYPEEEEEKPRHKERDTSTRKKSTARPSSRASAESERIEGIPVLFGDPVLIPQPRAEPQQVGHFVQAHLAYTINQDGMAVPYYGDVPGHRRVNFQPQVLDTSNGPQVHYFMTGNGGRDSGVTLRTMPMAGGFLQIPVSVAGQQTVVIPLQQVAATHQPVAQPVMQAFMLSPGAPPPSVLPQQIFLQNPQQMMQCAPVAEAHMLNEHAAVHSEIDEPQDFRPADNNPSRMYRVCEVDGTWTIRSRFTIDSLGDSRWYITDEGVFYAVRMPN